MDGSAHRQSGSRHDSVERRLAPEFRVAGRTLSGVAMRYGDVSPDFRERFEPGAFGEVRTIPINLQHDPDLVVAPAAMLTDSPRELRVRADLPEGSAALQLVRRGALNGFSVEFLARSERREGGVRVVERAELSGLALVDRGAYRGATAEVRARSGRTLRQRIPAGVNLGCRCSGVQCRFARITGEAMQEAFSEAWNEATEILAVRSNYGNPLASKSLGSLRAAVDDDGATVEIDLPAGPDGDSVIAAIENTGAVLARPYFDADGSDGTIESARAAAGENVMVYTRARVRSIVIGATDEVAGWPLPALVATPGMGEDRAAPAPRRRRIWL